ncbi:MAG: hypothetical protein RLZZ558_1461 [Planctomycetota bacterium]|jgi:glycosyltransferase involved in cell wall biosynthesis
MSVPVVALAWAGVACAGLPLLMTLSNLRRYRRQPAPHEPLSMADRVDVCIPARNEATNLRACVEGVLASVAVPVRALVYDDQSTDETPGILADLARADPRVRPVPTRTLPGGWNGKQWGCECMGQSSDAAWLLFTDADVRVSPEAVAAAVSFARRSRSDLVSSVPRQVCGTVGETLLVPLIHFMLLGYLPMGLMRRDTRASLAAGCGQFLLVRREMWLRSGGHAAFMASMHDGIKLPRSVRRAGGRTDLYDATPHVTCRMYRGFAQAWRGFAKNGFEGLGSVWTLLFFTGMHLVGHVLPWVLLAAWLAGFFIDDRVGGLAAAAACTGLLTRAVLAVRFRQPWLAVPLHPVSMAVSTALQWWSLWLHLRGKRRWKGR